jgi:hypothetical protein
LVNFGNEAVVFGEDSGKNTRIYFRQIEGRLGVSMFSCVYWALRQVASFLAVPFSGLQAALLRDEIAILGQPSFPDGAGTQRE